MIARAGKAAPLDSSKVQSTEEHIGAVELNQVGPGSLNRGHCRGCASVALDVKLSGLEMGSRPTHSFRGTHSVVYQVQRTMKHGRGNAA